MRKGVYRITALCLALVLCLTSCSTDRIATTMALSKTEGTVDVLDGRQKEIEPAEQLSLYSGYKVETHPVSYAWIDLDKVKLTKMDAESEIEIKKRRNDLEIMVNSGNLFFHITEPLGDEENLDIRTSSMIVGIRGTCGWIEAMEEEQMRVYVLEGTVACRRDKSGMKDEAASTENSQGKFSLQELLRRILLRVIPIQDKDKEEDQFDVSEGVSAEDSQSAEKESEKEPEYATEKEGEVYPNGWDNVYFVDCMGKDEEIYVSGGMMAELTYSSDGEEQIVLSPFDVSDIPDYVMEELLEDASLQQKITEESGLDISGSATDEVHDNYQDENSNEGSGDSGEESGDTAFFMNNTVYYRDPALCRLTPAQAGIFARRIQESIVRGETALLNDYENKT